MKSKSCVVVFVGLLWLNASAASTNPSRLKIMTLNFNAETNAKILTEKRFPIFEEKIKSEDADIVFVQESWQYHKYINFALKVAEDLNMDVAYRLEAGISWIRVDSITILAKKALHLRNVKSYKLPHSVPSIGDGVHTWFALGEVNRLLGATVTLPSGQEAYVWTAHLNANVEKNRVDQVKYAFQKMRDVAEVDGKSWEDALVFFGGDFNALPDSAEIDYLRGVAGFVDTWRLAHPEARGLTLVGDVSDPEYNPMVHGAGMFPTQEGFEETDRIDYMMIHSPRSFSAAARRFFTSPINGVWMSDHYGLEASFDFDRIPFADTPIEDADTTKDGPTTLFTLTEGTLRAFPAKKDFEVTSARGLTLVNDLDVNVHFLFTNGKGVVYPVRHAGLVAGDTVSFAFFNDGDFKYRMIVRDYRPSPGARPDYSREPITREMDGTVRVRRL